MKICFNLVPRAISLFVIGKAGNGPGIGYRILNSYWSTLLPEMILITIIMHEIDMQKLQIINSVDQGCSSIWTKTIL